MPFDIYNKKFQNWLKGVFGLNATRSALCECILDKLENVLSNISLEELHQFFLCLHANNISLLKKTKKGKSTYKRWECQHERCQELMRYFIDNHKDRLHYTWTLLGKSKRIVTECGGYHCKELKWNVIKLYMYTENEDVIKQCNSLDCLDITHVIKIIENCKLIATDCFAEPLEKVLDSRNQLMHSPDNKITDNDTWNILQWTKKLLDCLDIAEKTYYKNAMQELQYLSENDFVLRYQSEDCKRILADVIDAKHLADELYSTIYEGDQPAKSKSKRVQDMLENLAGLRSTKNSRLEMKVAEYKKISKEVLEMKIGAIKLDQKEFDRNSVEYKKMEDQKQRTERTVKVVIEQMNKLESEEMVDEIEKLRKEKESLKYERKQYNTEGKKQNFEQEEITEGIEKFRKENELPHDKINQNNTEILSPMVVSYKDKPMLDVNEKYKGLEIFQRPQCLLDTDKDGFLTIVKKTAEEMKQITSPVNVVAITGRYRTGKSFLMNRLAGETTGFALGSPIQSKTKGIWAWCKEHPTQKGQVLLLLDTEGLGDAEKGNPDHDNRILILATLLSSTLVYNMMTAFNQDAIEKLTFITKMSDNLKVSVTDTTDDNFDLLMPDFVLCIRDFTLDLEIDGRECSEDEYIEHCLRERRTGNSKLDDIYNRPRLCIKNYFRKRKAFTFDRPASRRAMINLKQVKGENLTKDFVHETKKFIAYVYGRPAKMLQNKKLVTGRMLLELLTAFVTAIKNGSDPCIDDALTVMSKQENERHVKEAICKFHVELGKLNMPVGNKTQLLEKKFSSQSSILTDLKSKLLFDDDNAVEMAVKAEMEKIFKEFEAENDKQVYKKCMTRITDIYQKVKRKIDSRTYMVSGGFEKYKKDMQSVVELYEIEQDNEQTGRMQMIKAKRVFLAVRKFESEAIMIADKAISDRERKDELEKRQKKLEDDFKEAQEKALKHFQMDLERLSKQHLAIVRKAQEEREAEKKAETFEEKLASRDAEILYMTKQLARLESKFKSQQIPEQPAKKQQ